MFKQALAFFQIVCCVLLLQTLFPITASAYSQPPAASPTPAAAKLLYAPILLYHHVGNPRAGRFNVTVDHFRAQMQWLHDNGYVSVSVDQIAAALRGEGELPPKPVAITFDDGWKDQLNNAVPILNEFGYIATFYIVGRWANSESPLTMNWKDVQGLRAQGYWIAAHSLSHKTETRLKPAALWQEIIGGRDLIAHAISETATTHAYPSGAVNTYVENMVRKAGYTAAVSVPSNCKQWASGVLRLNRIEVRNAYSLDAFAGWLTCKPLPVPPGARPLPIVSLPISLPRVSIDSQ